MKPDNHLETVECRAISQMLSRVGDKWTVMVVTFLGTESLRFSELRRRIGGISQKMLTTTLRNLERDGFVNRTVEPTSPPSVSYELTELGHDLLEPVSRLADWTRDNTHRIEQARSHYDSLAEK